jgi:hypothetical protein
MPARGHTERINKNTCQEIGKTFFHYMFMYLIYLFLISVYKLQEL